jgi:hypothetical protein
VSDDFEVANLGAIGPHAIVDKAMPSQQFYAEVRRRNLPVQVRYMPAGREDLGFLDPISDVLPGLIVTDYNCRDARQIEHMQSLTRLALSPTNLRLDVDLATVPNLSKFFGTWHHLESVVECRSLKEVTVYGSDPAKIAHMKSSLDRLDVMYARRWRAVPEIPTSKALKKLRIHAAPELDLRNISYFDALASLELESCRSLVNANELRRASSLDWLELNNCPAIDGWPDLVNLDQRAVTVNGRNPFDLRFRAEVAARGNWHFAGPPGPDR